MVDSLPPVRQLNPAAACMKARPADSVQHPTRLDSTTETGNIRRLQTKPIHGYAPPNPAAPIRPPPTSASADTRYSLHTIVTPQITSPYDLSVEAPLPARAKGERGCISSARRDHSSRLLYSRCSRVVPGYAASWQPVGSQGMRCAGVNHHQATLLRSPRQVGKRTNGTQRNKSRVGLKLGIPQGTSRVHPHTQQPTQSLHQQHPCN